MIFTASHRGIAYPGECPHRISAMMSAVLLLFQAASKTLGLMYSFKPAEYGDMPHCRFTPSGGKKFPLRPVLPASDVYVCQPECRYNTLTAFAYITDQLLLYLKYTVFFVQSQCFVSFFNIFRSCCTLSTLNFR